MDKMGFELTTLPMPTSGDRKQEKVIFLQMEIFFLLTYFLIGDPQFTNLERLMARKNADFKTGETSLLFSPAWQSALPIM